MTTTSTEPVTGDPISNLIEDYAHAVAAFSRRHDPESLVAAARHHDDVRRKLEGEVATLREALRAAEADRDEVRVALKGLVECPDCEGHGFGPMRSNGIGDVWDEKCGTCDGLGAVSKSLLAAKVRAETALRQAQADLAEQEAAHDKTHANLVRVADLLAEAREREARLVAFFDAGCAYLAADANTRAECDAIDAMLAARDVLDAAALTEATAAWLTDQHPTPTTDAEETRVCPHGVETTPDDCDDCNPCPHPRDPCAKCGASAGQPCPRMPQPTTFTDAEEA